MALFTVILTRRSPDAGTRLANAAVGMIAGLSFFEFPSPMVRLTRATFFALALMLGVFAVWALDGFDYPSTPVPTTLNIVAKLLSFAVVLTLFLPQRPPATASTPAG